MDPTNQLNEPDACSTNSEQKVQSTVTCPPVFLICHDGKVAMCDDSFLEREQVVLTAMHEGAQLKSHLDMFVVCHGSFHLRPF